MNQIIFNEKHVFHVNGTSGKQPQEYKIIFLLTTSDSGQTHIIMKKKGSLVLYKQNPYLPLINSSSAYHHYSILPPVLIHPLTTITTMNLHFFSEEQSAQVVEESTLCCCCTLHTMVVILAGVGLEVADAA